MKKIIIECEDRNIDRILSFIAMHKLAETAKLVEGNEEIEVVLPAKRRLPEPELTVFQRAKKIINNHIIK